MNAINITTTATATAATTPTHARPAWEWYSPRLKASIKAACEEIEREEAEKMQFARALAEANCR